ncbi:hypothetical protein V1264_017278 [Littorina saxatilis]|uniref:Uncharacterized protein n=1 Tax=Littorina saxatilis TaxID=31220 RepID=A0AAN9BH17_9CAEN
MTVVRGLTLLKSSCPYRHPSALGTLASTRIDPWSSLLAAPSLASVFVLALALVSGASALAPGASCLAGSDLDLDASVLVLAGSDLVLAASGLVLDASALAFLFSSLVGFPVVAVFSVEFGFASFLPELRPFSGFSAVLVDFASAVFCAYQNK